MPNYKDARSSLSRLSMKDIRKNRKRAIQRIENANIKDINILTFKELEKLIFNLLNEEKEQ